MDQTRDTRALEFANAVHRYMTRIPAPKDPHVRCGICGKGDELIAEVVLTNQELDDLRLKAADAGYSCKQVQEETDHGCSVLFMSPPN